MEEAYERQQREAEEEFCPDDFLDDEDDFMDDASMEFEYLEHTALLESYKCFYQDDSLDSGASLKAQVNNLLNVALADYDMLDDIEVEDDQTLFRCGALQHLNQLRREKFGSDFALLIQKHVRGFFARKTFKIMKMTKHRAKKQRQPHHSSPTNRPRKPRTAVATSISEDGQRHVKGPSSRRSSSSSPTKSKEHGHHSDSDQVRRLRQRQAEALQKTRQIISKQVQHTSNGKDGDFEVEKRRMLDEIEALKKANHLLAANPERDTSSFVIEPNVERQHCLRPSESFAWRKATATATKKKQSSPVRTSPKPRAAMLQRKESLRSQLTPSESFIFNRSATSSPAGSKRVMVKEISLGDCSTTSRGLTPTESFLFRPRTSSPRRMRDNVKEIDLGSPVSTTGSAKVPMGKMLVSPRTGSSPPSEKPHESSLTPANRKATNGKERPGRRTSAAGSVPRSSASGPSPRRPKGSSTPRNKVPRELTLDLDAGDASPKTPHNSKSARRPENSAGEPSPRTPRNYKEMFEKARKNERAMREKVRLLEEMNTLNEEEVRVLTAQVQKLKSSKQSQGLDDALTVQVCEKTMQDIADMVVQNCKDSALRDMITARLDEYEQKMNGCDDTSSKPGLVESESSGSSLS